MAASGNNPVTLFSGIHGPFFEFGPPFRRLCHSAVTKQGCNDDVIKRPSGVPCGADVQKHILIVEDETSIRDMVAFALRKAGMEAMHAADARAAQARHAGTRRARFAEPALLPLARRPPV